MRRVTEHLLNDAVIEPLEKRWMLSVSLLPTFTGRLPAVLPPTGIARVSIRVTNPGTTSVLETTTARLFASSDASLDGGDTQLAALPERIRIKPKGSEKLTIAFPAPTHLADGQYFLLAEVDGSTAIGASARAIPFRNPFSDVAVRFGNLPAQPVEIDGPCAGTRIVNAILTNTGNVTARGKVTLSFYLSADTTLDSSDPLLATASGKSIAIKPGGHKAIPFRVAVPVGTTPGGYFLIAMVTPTTLPAANLANTVAVSSERLAVVNQLPRRGRHDRSGYYGYGGYEEVDDGSYVEVVDDGSGDTPDPDNGGNNTPDTTQSDVSGDSGDNSDNTTQPSTDDSSDDSDSSDESSWGD